MAEVNYTLTFKQDKYFVTNNEALLLNFTLSEIDECTVDKTILEGTIEPGIEYELPLKLDGKYNMNMLSTEVPGDESNLYINYYLNLQLSMIEDIFTVLCPCDCGCSNCVDLSTDQYQALLTTRNKIDVFKYLTCPKYDSSFTDVHRKTSCLIEPQLYCDVATEGVTGNSQYNQKLTKELIALDYLTMYFSDLNAVVDEDEIAYINTKYQSEAVLCCISKLGIDIKEIQQIITDMAVITINSGSYTNLPPDVVGNNTIGTSNRTTLVFTMAMFTSGTTPPYNDPEGDPADAVRVDTLPPDGELQLNGSPVSAGQIITKVDIDNNLFTFVPPDQDAVDADQWNFSVRDSGSGQFSS